MNMQKSLSSHCPALSRRVAFCVSLALLLTFLVLPGHLLAKPADKELSSKAARGWLKQSRYRLQAQLSDQIDTIDAFTDVDGQLLGYIVHLDPQGFVVISADDEVEPVIAFSPTGYVDDTQDNPLANLLKKDLKERLRAAKNKTLKKIKRNADKWDSLLAAESLDAGIAASTASISDVRVAPFLMTEWNQGDADGGYCYNYYTPNHYPTGCVATAMAQVMRYHSWPTSGIGVNSFQITVNGVPETRSTLGGNGSGGPYVWSQMPTIPQNGLTTIQRQAIGRLSYDTAISVYMAFTASGSSAALFDGDQRMTDTFDYDNCIFTGNFPTSGNSSLWTIINSNMDAQLPVILGISRVGGGHAVVVDGYGYDTGTLYHHVNMGWGGLDNTWYQLPLIDASFVYTMIDDCMYNIYPTGSGEIISGRVTSLAGVPLDAVAITARVGTTIVQQTTTDAGGIYAFANLASNTLHRISAVKSGYSFADQFASTAQSTDGGSSSGNVSAVDFVSSNATPPTAFDDQVNVDADSAVTIQLLALDDNLPDPNTPLQYIITSLPDHGSLSEPNGIDIPIVSVPHTLSNDGDRVDYRPCPYFGGDDTFEFKANDGGVPATGGDSNIATITVQVDNQLYTDYETNTNTYTGLMMDTGAFYDVRSEVIYRQSDIGSAKRITDLALRIYIEPGRTLSNWTIRMQHTNWNTFTDVVNMFPSSGWTTVYQDNVTITQDGWINFHFDTPFDYNGTQNLLVDFSFNNSGRTAPSGGYFFKNVGSNRVLSLASTTGTHGDPLNWTFWSLGGTYYLGSFVPSMKLIGTALVEPLLGDFNASCSVTMPDFGIFADAWMAGAADPLYNPDCDIAAPYNLINLADLNAFLGQWLEIY